MMMWCGSGNVWNDEICVRAGTRAVELDGADDPL